MDTFLHLQLPSHEQWYIRIDIDIRISLIRPKGRTLWSLLLSDSYGVSVRKWRLPNWTTGKPIYQHPLYEAFALACIYASTIKHQNYDCQRAIKEVRALCLAQLPKPRKQAKVA